MFKLFMTVFALLMVGAYSLSSAQTPSTGAAAAPVKDAAPEVKSAPAAAGEAAGYKQAMWGMSKAEVKDALHIDISRAEPHSSITDLPWEITRLAGIAESAPDDLVGENLEWFYGERQDIVFGFYKNRFFSYTSGLDKILPVAEYKQKITSKHGASSRILNFQDTDPAEDKVTASYELTLWEMKKTTIVLGTEKLFPAADQEPELNYEITYLGTDIFADFKKDAGKILAQLKDEEDKQNEKQLQEQKDSALEVIQ